MCTWKDIRRQLMMIGAHLHNEDDSRFVKIQPSAPLVFSISPVSYGTTSGTPFFAITTEHRHTHENGFRPHDMDNTGYSIVTSRIHYENKHRLQRWWGSDDCITLMQDQIWQYFRFSHTHLIPLTSKTQWRPLGILPKETGKERIVGEEVSQVFKI